MGLEITPQQAFPLPPPNVSLWAWPLCTNTLPTSAGAGHQWTESTNTGCNQWLSLVKIALKVSPADRNRSPRGMHQQVWGLYKCSLHYWEHEILVKFIFDESYQIRVWNSQTFMKCDMTLVLRSNIAWCMHHWSPVFRALQFKTSLSSHFEKIDFHWWVICKLRVLWRSQVSSWDRNEYVNIHINLELK